MTYEFYITTASSVSYQVYPLNWLECTLVDEKEDDEVFHRRKFQGALTFGGKKLCADYNLFYDIEQSDPCGQIYLFIFRDGDSFWEGYFSTSMGEWDYDNMTFTVTPEVIDDYTVFDQEGDTEYSVLTQSAVTVNMIYNGVTYAFDRFRYLMDFIEYVADQICGATVNSLFLTNGTNYVTLGTNHYNLLCIAQKSDVKRWDSSNAATEADMSWNQLMELLGALNLKWTYDALTNIVTIEHISYFNATEGFDIRTQEIAQANNKYSYLKDETPKYEKFAWMESKYDEFLPATIWYDSMCVSQNPKNNIKEYAWNVTTDIQYICDCIEDVNGEGLIANISDDGWVLLACYDDGGLQVYQTNRPANNIYFNCDLGWGIIFNALFKHERMYIEGYMKGILTTFWTMKKNKKQETAMICCTDFDPGNYITTELGETWLGGQKGYVQRAELSPDCSIKLSLLYGEPDNENTGFSYGKGMVITEVKTTSPNTTTYTAVLTGPADADLQMKIRLVVQGTALDFCTTAWFDLDILTGNTTGNVAIPWCTPVGGCPCRIAIHQWDDSGLLDWDWTVIYDPTVYVF
jgi:hypothetical protein